MLQREDFLVLLRNLKLSNFVKNKVILAFKILLHRILLFVSKISGRRSASACELSIIVLNYNRRGLLEKTVNSLLATAPSSMEMWVVDNGSTDGSVEWIKNWASNKPFVHLSLNRKNRGGEAFNKVLRCCRGTYILISENDLEYLPGWFEKLSRPFKEFKNLGLISPLSPFPDIDSGELWVSKPHREMIEPGIKIYEAKTNIGTSAFFLSKLVDKGVFYKTLRTKEFLFPDDGDFSRQVKSLGLFVAWSETSQVINWGHRQSEWEKNPEYYEQNWKSKSELSIDGLQTLDKTEALLQAGIRIHQEQAFKTRGRLLAKKEGVLMGEGSLFLDTGQGFSPRSVITTEWKADNNNLVVEIPLKGIKNLKKLRWDPVEGELVRISDIKIVLKASDGIIHEISSNEVNADLQTNDPQISFNVPKGDWSVVEIQLAGFSFIH